MKTFADIFNGLTVTRKNLKQLSLKFARAAVAKIAKDHPRATERRFDGAEDLANIRKAFETAFNNLYSTSVEPDAPCTINMASRECYSLGYNNHGYRYVGDCACVTLVRSARFSHSNSGKTMMMREDTVVIKGVSADRI